MIARLTDPWFAARFVTETTALGHRYTDSLDGADGVCFWCPCGYGRPEFPLDGARPHAVIASFANPRGAPAAPPDAGSHSRDGKPSRWTMSGTGLADLTLSPSVDVGTPSCWHGWIVNGEVR
jgi:Family of unknown function (DUF6527)